MCTRGIFDSMDQCTEVYEPVADGQAVPAVNCIRQKELPSDSDLNRELWLLQREISHEISECSTLGTEISEALS